MSAKNARCSAQPRSQVVQHDVAADLFEPVLGHLLGQFLVTVRGEFLELLARDRSPQQRVSPVDDDRPLLGDHLVIPPGIGVHGKQLALRHPLRALELRGRLGVQDAAVVVGLHRQLVLLKIGRHHLVLPAGEEHRRSGVTLTSCPASQLVVQSLGVVPAGADDMQPAQFGDLVVVSLIGAAQPDVGAATRHLGRHRYGAELAGLSDDLGSSASFFAFSTTAGMPALTRRSCSSSDSATSRVPISAG